ncbi:30S ribosomal protein S17 [Patescibacteria group bacterium]
MTTTDKKIIRKLTGTVVSTKMDKTIVVKVDRVRWHAKYSRQYKVSKKYKVHDPANSAQVGQTVTIIASRPLSKGKKWRLEQTVNMKEKS